MTNSENKKKILVIDDNRSLNTVLVDKLSFSGFDATGVYDGEAGLEKALSMHPDIILLDLVMPKMDGLAMLGKLREDSWGKTCKVIVLTLIGEQEYIAKAVEYGIAGYVIKTEYSLDGIIKQVTELVK